MAADRKIVVFTASVIATPATPSTTDHRPASHQHPVRWRQALHRLRQLIGASKGHGLWIAVWSVVGWVGTLLVPVLNEHPFLLMLLSPRTVFVTVASGSVALAPFVLLGTLRLCIADASYFVIGRRAPTMFANPTDRPAKRSLFRRAMQLTDRLCRWLTERPGLAFVVLFLRPNAKYMALGGAYGVRAITAASAALLGTVSYLTLMHVGANLVF